MKLHVALTSALFLSASLFEKSGSFRELPKCRIKVLRTDLQTQKHKSASNESFKAVVGSKPTTMQGIVGKHNLKKLACIKLA